MINESNYNEASDYINGLEHLLVENSPLTVKDIADKKLYFIKENHNIETFAQQNKYLNDFAEYIGIQMDKYGVSYE